MSCWTCTPVRTRGLGVADPSSTYCKEQGGSIEIIETPAGQDGECVFPSGERVNAWEFFRAQGQAPSAVERWDAKGDLIAGAFGFALPLGYDLLAPKRWPALKLWHKALMVIGGYLGASYVYRRL